MIMLPHKGLYIGDRIATWMLYVRESCDCPLPLITASLSLSPSMNSSFHYSR